MLGAAASRPRLGADLSEFLQRTRIPYFSTQMGKGIAGQPTDGEPAKHPIDLWMGTAALSERDYVHEAIDQADVIIAIGHDTVEKPPFLDGARRSHGHPHRLHTSHSGGTGVFPARIGGRQRRPQASPSSPADSQAGCRTRRRYFTYGTASCGEPQRAPLRTGSR